MTKVLPACLLSVLLFAYNLANLIRAVQAGDETSGIDLVVWCGLVGNSLGLIAICYIALLAEINKRKAPK